MALADLATVQKRVVSILNAAPGSYSATVSGDVGAFEFQEEVTEAIFEADSNIATQAYFQSSNPELANPFSVVSSAIINGGDVPFHHGEISLVEVEPATNTWVVGIESESMDDIINAKANEAYVQAGAYSFLYKMFGGQFYTTALAGRVHYPQYVKTSVLQCNQNETTLIVAEAVKILARNSSPALFEYYGGLSAAGMQMIVRDGSFTEQTMGEPVK